MGKRGVWGWDLSRLWAKELGNNHNCQDNNYKIYKTDQNCEDVTHDYNCCHNDHDNNNHNHNHNNNNPWPQVNQF